MTILQMREALKNVPKYKGARKWIERVDSMHDMQVLAVYTRFVRDGEL